MKKIFIFILAVGFSSWVFSQNTIYYPSIFNIGECAYLDTNKYVYPAQDQSGNPYLITGSGVFGGVAQTYSLSSEQNIVGVYFLMVKAQDGVNTEAKIQLLDDFASDVLAEVSYSSDEIGLNLPEYYQYFFSHGVSVKDFVIGVRFPQFSANNTAAVIIPTTKDGCSEGLPAYVYYQNQWQDIEQLYNLNFNLFVFPIINAVGLENIDVNSLSYVYPNPADNNVFVASSIKINNIEIYNTIGQRIYSDYVNDLSVKINTVDWSSGTYIVKIYTDNGMATKKIMKH
ncbi:MAG: T9SS type A sorting domain-containing protein [Bacteroidales bacterium]|jgi:hypothetical protein|nr:T9SS type A sorting domain-containing protein [Bacteroidales bacterium]